ncbi:Hemolysin C [Roseovarius sp. THAF8]|uniref:hemolysin family protein n=1 Tax=Roseovarius sp. THAF8 TaxID=2587846 RepID=UPI00126860C9|nr:hemolysin family protein [Roseovarius sp. THAF8]QFT99270.1 Hemolysin C [Roseovarius sp. THAF8]
MNDSNDASSMAAHGARPEASKGDDPAEDQNDTQGGFFRRFFGALGADEDHNGEEDDLGGDGGETSANGLAPNLGLGNLRRLSVEDVMIPKADIVSVPATITMDELVHTFRDSGLTRLPVYEGTLDTPVGFAHLKDFALKHGFNGHGSDYSLEELLRPLMYVPPSMTIGVLLQKMQAERRHMALVIDEYGGVDGLVTIEDLIEQVVGEIADEHDQDEGAYWSEEKPGSYVVQAKAPLEEFEAEIGLSLTDSEEIDEEEIDTLGGLVFMLLGRVPARGELVEHPSGVEIQVLDSDPRRIKRLRVRLPEAIEV